MVKWIGTFNEDKSMTVKQGGQTRTVPAGKVKSFLKAKAKDVPPIDRSDRTR